jgi:hypothetical protein
LDDQPQSRPLHGRFRFARKAEVVQPYPGRQWPG